MRAAESYFTAAQICASADQKKYGNAQLLYPIFFLFAQSTELVFKAWLINRGKSPRHLRDIGHDLKKLYVESWNAGLRVDGADVLLEYADGETSLHDDGEDFITEKQRLQKFSRRRLELEYCRHLRILAPLHQSPYILRYPQTGFFSTPNIRVIEIYLTRLLNLVWPPVMSRARPK